MSLDTWINEFDRGLRAVAGVTRAGRPLPVPAAPAQTTQPQLSERERRHVAGLMRVNHVGEVCAQALYQAQKLATPSERLRVAFERAGREEEDHLAWTATRLSELGARPSLLNPLWYTGALAIGFIAGKAGDRISLGFMAETERQVEQHLDGHLERLPAQDARSRAILEQMRADEIVHGQTARDAGGVELPAPVRQAMKLTSKIMTTIAYVI